MGHVPAQRYLHPTKYRSSWQRIESVVGLSIRIIQKARRLCKVSSQSPARQLKLPKAPAGTLNGSGHDGRKISYRVYNPRKKLNQVQRREMRGYERRLPFLLTEGLDSGVRASNKQPSR